jgi:predicted  nucleic acid-binding Zn-ribbon protein
MNANQLTLEIEEIEFEIKTATKRLAAFLKTKPIEPKEQDFEVEFEEVKLRQELETLQNLLEEKQAQLEKLVPKRIFPPTRRAFKKNPDNSNN